MTVKPFLPAPPHCSQRVSKTLEVPLHNVGRDLGRVKIANCVRKDIRLT